MNSTDPTPEEFRTEPLPDIDATAEVVATRDGEAAPVAAVRTDTDRASEDALLADADSWSRDPSPLATTGPTPADSALVPPSGTVVDETVAAEADPIPRPRTRWAGIIWGFILLAISVLGVLAVVQDGVRATIENLWFSLTPVSSAAYLAIALGGIAVVCAAVGLIGRAQRGAAQRSRL
ncbi:hypothetical protein [Microbacterium gorillae]|uniref:hypothetical protein n=1 Tax=Microbacterium gorillae TaxID=1231063 RepID=UPI00059023CD|nr:hypothetical protein [Microbacterium gorillae]